jgi:5-hydroxyisourate hydrolase
MTVSTHVLDASLGRPATEVSVTLSRHGGYAFDRETPDRRWVDEGWVDVESGTTDAEGRHRFGADTPAGTYRLVFGTGAYFAGRGVAAFYPEVIIAFTVPEPDGPGPDAPVSGGPGRPAPHFHVPLLLSPFSYSTYRGS